MNRPSYKNLRGRNIEERSAAVEDRIEPGHSEMDLVVGKPGESKEVLLTMTERTSKREIIRKLPDKTQASVIHAMDVRERQSGQKRFQETFRTITVDNGSEFLNSSEMERSCLSQKKSRTMVYYALPYSASQIDALQKIQMNLSFIFLYAILFWLVKNKEEGNNKQ